MIHVLSGVEYRVIHVLSGAEHRVIHSVVLSIE
jgi:hypothetical protein